MSALSAAIYGAIPWTWLTHQWWFIAGLLVVGLVAGQVAEKEVGN